MVQQVGSIPIEVPDSISQIVPFIPEKGGTAIWSFVGSIGAIAGNSQNISPFVIFQVPYAAILKNVRMGIERVPTAGGIPYNSNKLLLLLYDQGPQVPVLSNSIINSGPAISQPNFVRFYGDPYQGGFNYDTEIDLVPNVNYSLDVTIEEVITAGDTQAISIYLQTLRK